MVDGDEPAPLPTSGRCTTLSGLLVDEGSEGLWKLLTGSLEQAIYLGPHWPNRSTDVLSSRAVQHCADGCLYELRGDPLETTDLAAARPAKAKALRAKLAAYERTAFNPRRGKMDPRSVATAEKTYGGFWGPWLP